MKRAENVNQYITNTPLEFQASLNKLRALIKNLAAAAQERISYGMPYYDYKGRLVYFAAMKGYIGLYIPPPIIANFAKELKSYVTTKSAIHFPVKKLPVALIKKLIKARMKYLDTL